MASDLDFSDMYDSEEWATLLFNASDADLGEFASDPSMSLPEYVVEMAIQQYLPPIQFFMAMVGNILTILVMLRMKDSVHLMCSYLAIIAVMDTFIIALSSGNAWLSRLAGQNYLSLYMNQSEICCKVVTFLQHLCLHLGAWVMVTVVIENLVINLRPSKVLPFKSQRVTDVMCLLLVLVMCLNLHYFWTYGLIDVEFEFGFDHRVVSKHCFFQIKTLKGESHSTDGFIWVVLDRAFVDYLPMILVIVSLIITHLAIAGRLGVSPKEYRPSWSKGFLDANAFATLTSRTLPVLGWTMPITCLPNLVFFHLSARYNTEANPGSAHRWALATAVLGEWKMLFFSAKYFVYIITCRKVRQVTLEVLSPITRRLYAVYLYMSMLWTRIRELPNGIRRVQQEDVTNVDQVEAFV